MIIVKQVAKSKTEELFQGNGVKIVTEEEYRLAGNIAYQNNNYIVSKLMNRNRVK